MNAEQGRAPVGGARRSPRQLAGRYRLEEPLGSGGAAVVWRAYDAALDRRVAIKVLDPNLSDDQTTSERFRREAIAAAGLNHPNAVVIHDIGRQDSHVYLVMELIAGPTLADIIDQHAPLDPGVVISLGHQVASALGAAHARGLVHRDVKPANVLLMPEGVAKVADFGIAKALGDAQTRLTAPGAVVGTVGYLSPEQLSGESIDARSDVYSLGLVLYECLTGRPAFQRDTAHSAAAARLAVSPPTPGELREGIPAVLDEVVVRATRREPPQRFEDGGALAAALAPSRTEETDAQLAELIGDTVARRSSADRTHHLTGAAETHAVPAGPPEGSAPTEQVEDTDGATEQVDAHRQIRRITAPGARRQPPPQPPPQPRPDEPAPASQPAPVSPSQGAPNGRPPLTERTASALNRARQAAVRQVPPGGSRTGTGTVGVGGVSIGQRQALVIFATLLVGAVLLAGIFVFAQSGQNQPVSQPPGGPPQADVPQAEAPQADQPQTAGGGGAAIRVASAQDFDPFADGGEHSEEVAAAYDGDPGTAWHTERYTSPDLGGLKPGVGLVFELADPGPVQQVTPTIPSGGIDFQLYALNEPPGGDPSGWGEPVATVEDAGGGQVTVTLDRPVEARYWLMWITQLPSGSNQAAVAEVSFHSG